MSDLQSKVQKQYERVVGLELLDFNPEELVVNNPEFIEEYLNALIYARDIEHNVDRYSNDVLTVLGEYGVTKSYTGLFIPSWRAQEERHGNGFEVILDQASDKVKESPEFQISYRLEAESPLKIVIGGLALGKTERGANIADLNVNWKGLGTERFVKDLYGYLRQRAVDAGETDIARTYSQIMHQEFVHDAMFALNEEYLRSKTRPIDFKIARTIFKQFWDPVGVTSKHHRAGFGETAFAVVGEAEKIDEQLVKPIEELYMRILDTKDTKFLKDGIDRALSLAQQKRRKASKEDALVQESLAA